MPLYKVRLRNRDTDEVVVVDVPARARSEAASLAKPRDSAVIVESVEEVAALPESSAQPAPHDPQQHGSHDHDRRRARRPVGIIGIILGVAIGNILTMVIIIAFAGAITAYAMSEWNKAVAAVNGGNRTDRDLYQKEDADLWEQIRNDGSFSTREEQVAEFRRRRIDLHARLDRENAESTAIFNDVFYGPDRRIGTADDPDLPADVLLTLYMDRMNQIEKSKQSK